MTTLRDSNDFRTFTEDGRCWICGGVVALLLGYDVAEAMWRPLEAGSHVASEPACCYVSIAKPGCMTRGCRRRLR